MCWVFAELTLTMLLWYLRLLCVLILIVTNVPNDCRVHRGSAIRPLEYNNLFQDLYCQEVREHNEMKN